MNSAYTLLTDEVAYRQACDTVLGRAGREILIFDRDLAALRLEDRIRMEMLAGFLRADGRRGIRVVLHDPGNAPRLMQLIARHSHQIELRQTPENLRHLTDTHVLVDEAHGVRRFHADQPRSALILDHQAYLDPWRRRFEELWESSRPCSLLNTTGL